MRLALTKVPTLAEDHAAQQLMANLAEAMRARGWANADLQRAFLDVANLVVPLSTMTGWFGGKGGRRLLPQARFLIHLPRVLGVEDRWFFSNEGPMQRRPPDRLSSPQTGEVLAELAAFNARMHLKYGSALEDGGDVEAGDLPAEDTPIGLALATLRAAQAVLGAEAEALRKRTAQSGSDGEHHAPTDQ